MSAFCRQLAERTESSSSSTGRNRFSLSGPRSRSSRGSATSASSSKLMKIASCSFRIFAANATRVLGPHAAVGPDLERQPVVVGALADARVGHRVVHLARPARRSSRSGSCRSDRPRSCCARPARSRGRASDDQLHVERRRPSTSVAMCWLGVQDLDARAGLTMSAAVTSRSPLHLRCARSPRRRRRAAEAHLLQVQHDVGDVLAHARDRRELVQHAVDPDRGDRRALQRRQQHAPQRVAERGAEAALERLADELAVASA